jgi:excinuclease ABC subunit B
MNRRRSVEARAARPYIPPMAHNNGMIPRGSARGLSEAGARFKAAAMTAAELAGFVPHRPARPEKSEGGKRF